ncbi:MULTISPECIES: hypothetical protein [unclassified Marinovum]
MPILALFDNAITLCFHASAEDQSDGLGFMPELPHICGYSGRGRADWPCIAWLACPEFANAQGSSDISGVTSSLRCQRANDRFLGMRSCFRKVVVSGFRPVLACIESERIAPRVSQPAQDSVPCRGILCMWQDRNAPVQILRRATQPIIKMGQQFIDRKIIKKVVSEHPRPRTIQQPSTLLAHFRPAIKQITRPSIA